ncbi:MAG: hypothetical protein R3B48_02770 [Kofleriaceae bacterium]
MSTTRSHLLLAALAAFFLLPDVPVGEAGPAGPPRAEAAEAGAHARQSRRPRRRRRSKSQPKPEPTEPSEPADAGEPADAAPAEPAPEEPAGGDRAPTSAPAAPAAPADEPTAPALASSAELVDVDVLRQEYLQLRDELFRSHARASTLSSALYSTKISIRLAFTTGRHYGVTRATIRLDGASVFDDTDGAIAGDDAIRFEGYLAPGKHVLAVRVEASGKDDDRFTSANEAQVTLQAVAGKDLLVTAKAKDSGDIAYAWKRDERGSYGLGLDISVKTVKRATKTAARPAAASPAVALGDREARP